MKIKQLLLAALFLAAAGIAEGQKFASVSGDLLTLDNGVIRRVIQVNTDNHGIISKSYSLKSTGDEFLSAGSVDFYFEADGKSFTGPDNWKQTDVKTVNGENGGNGAVVILEDPEAGIRLSITYMLYPRPSADKKKNLISEYR